MVHRQRQAVSLDVTHCCQMYDLICDDAAACTFFAINRLGLATAAATWCGTAIVVSACVLLHSHCMVLNLRLCAGPKRAMLPQDSCYQTQLYRHCQLVCCCLFCSPTSEVPCCMPLSLCRQLM